MKRSFIILPALLVVVVAWGLLGCEKPIRQPISYNHKIHVEELGLSCSDCHQYSDRLARAGIPGLAVCADCHSEPNGESAAEAQVVEYVQSDTPIPWLHVNQTPQHVYFSHRRHVKIGRLECARCHGAVEDLEKPMSKPFVPITMSWCMECHQERGVTNDCLACHK